MLLSVSDLCITYGKRAKPTVSNISFSLEAGEIVALVGQSGSGKTSVIRALLGCLGGGGRVSAGQMLFDGQDLAHVSQKQWRTLRGRGISMIFQDAGAMMDPIQTIGQQFTEYILEHTHSLRTRKEAKRRTETLLSRMNLASPETILSSYPFELSGGMRQRVGIAMALAFHPKLLLADEPTAALDVTTQAQIVKELMRVIRASGTSMLLVTHNIGVAAQTAGRILVMSEGRMVEYGNTSALLSRPQAEYTKELLAAVPEIGGLRYVS